MSINTEKYLSRKSNLFKNNFIKTENKFNRLYYIWYYIDLTIIYFMYAWNWNLKNIFLHDTLKKRGRGGTQYADK